MSTSRLEEERRQRVLARVAARGRGRPARLERAHPELLVVLDVELRDPEWATRGRPRGAPAALGPVRAL